jgi:hypothetical protein
MTTSAKRSTAQQLPLPCTFEQATSLLDDLTTLRSTVTWQRSKIAVLQEELDAAKADAETWRNLHRLADMQLAAVHAEIALLQTNLAVARRLIFHSTSPVPDWLSQELRRLLTASHPDKWSQGQPATELAHEVAAALNTLRQRLGEGQA